MWQIIGSLAAVFTMFSFVPQIYKVYKTKSVKDVSSVTLVQLAIGVSLWIAYGVHQRDPIIIVANAVTLLCMIILLIFYGRYRRLQEGKPIE
jgi:MtN3 and saliva related transmembrane protein